jgi:enediyne biosynthesis protein E4
VDYDRDGWLDLFVCNYVRFRTLADDKFCSLVAYRKSYCPPGAYAGEACILYRNNRDGSFRDVSRETGIAPHIGNSLGIAVLDFDDDGWPDIAVANDETPNFLFHNVSEGATGDRRQSASGAGDGSGRRFEEIGLESGLAVAENGKPKAGMGIDTADYRNDGGLGILVSNFSNEGLSFYRREGDLLPEVSFATGFGAPSLLTLGFGLFFFDMDNDTRPDAFVANGHVNDDIQLAQSNLTYRQRPLLFRNRGDGSFEEVGRAAGPPFRHEEVGRGAAYGDYDRDGDLDILVSNNNGPAELLRNEGSPPGGRARAGNWLQVEVKGRGPGRGWRGARDGPALSGGTNRSGIGARVRVKAGGVVQTRWVRSGSSYLSQSMLWQHFGLGRAARADWVEVTWTDGRRQRWEDVRANQHLVIEEGEPELTGTSEEARGKVP